MSNCTIARRPMSSLWSELTKTNKWLFVVNQTTTMDIICDNEIFPTTLSGAGLIEFEEQCLIERGDMVIQTTKSVTTHTVGSFTPAFNITNILQRRNEQLQLESIQYEENIELRELDQNVRELQRKAEQPEINIHDIHHFLMFYATVASVAVIYFVYKHNHVILRVRRRKQPDAADGANEQAHESSNN